MKYFTVTELACKKTGGFKLAHGFGDRLDALREAFGKPLIVNSCCRSKEHNNAIGGSPYSLHVFDFPTRPTGGTCAIDFRLFEDKEENELLKELALHKGFSVLDERSCIHIDDRTRVLGLPQIRGTWAPLKK